MKTKILFLSLIFVNQLHSASTITNCEAKISDTQTMHATLLANLSLQIKFQQGKIDAGICSYKMTSKRNELDSKASQIKVKYKLVECTGLSKSLRPRSELTLTYAPKRQKMGIELFALQDQHPLICLDKTFDFKLLEKNSGRE